ncbi:MAG TPA: mechanosensitive ion channel domain-containing protein [Lacunisphaera sp.]|jgi:small-conductance mechanosensitive channel
MRVYFIRLVCAMVLCTTVFAKEEQRIAQLRDAVRSLEEVMADKNSPPADQAKLQRKLDGLKQELGIMEEREEIEAREKSLKEGVHNQTREWLRDKLQTVSSVSAAVDARQLELDTMRAKATAERTLLVKQREDTSLSLTPAQRAEIDEQFYTKNEEIRAIALQQEAAEYELMLIKLAKTMREQTLNEDAGNRLSLRTFFEMRAEQQGYVSRARQTDAMISNVSENLSVTQAGLDLTRQKLAKIGEELQLLERQSSFLHRNPQLDQLLATERAQQQFVGLRLPFLSQQVDALHLSGDFLRTQRDLIGHDIKLYDEQVAALRAAYVDRLLPPATAISVIILIYLLSSRLVLPHRFKKEELFMARRLGRYGTFLIVTVILVLYLMEDLRVIATTLGLVSAAVVISLQDVCASFFGWSVIMLSRKFIIGDRLEIEGTRGDVLDIQLLRTTLLEVNNWLGVDQPTGRVVVFPNNFIFKSKVFNFSHGHPYIWGKVEVTVTYSTPVAEATLLFQKVLEEETRENFVEAQRASTIMQRRYGVEDAEYTPKIYTRVADSGITFSLIYVSHYRRSSSTRNRINVRLIAELEKRSQIQLAYNTLAVQPLTTTPNQPSAILGGDGNQMLFMARPGG